MPTWSAEVYLRFVDERTRPCRELAARVAVESPRRVVDLGCGPGNSTQVVAQRWPQAEIVAVDSSPEMIDAARKAYPNWQFRLADIAAWAAETERLLDIVFSNAALQWVPDHGVLFPRLLNQVASGGALAVQVPANFHAPAHRLMRELAASATWRDRLPTGGVREWNVHEADFYFDALASTAAKIDLWTTEYIQIMPSVEAILDWYRGTGLRPFLDALGSDAERELFTQEYLAAIRTEYVPQRNGQVLFPFRRMFVIAYRD